MLRARGWLAGLVVAAFCGCSVVASVAPVGELPQELSQADWGGTWIHQEQPIKIRAADQPQGMLQVAWVEDKGGRLQLESYQVEMRKSGEWLFGNIKAREGPAPYLWGLVKLEPGQIIIWPPEQEHFKKLVQSGALPGKVDKDGDVVLEQLTPEHLKLLMSETLGVPFDWKKPLVFFRIGK